MYQSDPRIFGVTQRWIIQFRPFRKTSSWVCLLMCALPDVINSISNKRWIYSISLTATATVVCCCIIFMMMHGISYEQQNQNKKFLLRNKCDGNLLSWFPVLLKRYRLTDLGEWLSRVMFCEWNSFFTSTKNVDEINFNVAVQINHKNGLFLLWSTLFCSKMTETIVSFIHCFFLILIFFSYFTIILSAILFLFLMTMCVLNFAELQKNKKNIQKDIDFLITTSSSNNNKKEIDQRIIVLKLNTFH